MRGKKGPTGGKRVESGKNKTKKGGRKEMEPVMIKLLDLASPSRKNQALALPSTGERIEGGIKGPLLTFFIVRSLCGRSRKFARMWPALIRARLRTLASVFGRKFETSLKKKGPTNFSRSNKKVEFFHQRPKPVLNFFSSFGSDFEKISSTLETERFPFKWVYLLSAIWKVEKDFNSC